MASESITHEHRLFFYSGPLILLSSMFLLYQGYKGVWLSILQSSSFLSTIAALATVVAIVGLARFFERLATISFRSKRFFISVMATFVGILLFAFSSLGVANALYYWVAGRTVLESGLENLSNNYALFSSETAKLTTTPERDRLLQSVQAPLSTLVNEIKSKNCGIGPGARTALAEIQNAFSFQELRFTRTPKCTETRLLEEMATQYRNYIIEQLYASPAVVREHVKDKQKLGAYVSEHYQAFQQKAAGAIASVNAAAQGVKFFGSRDAFNNSIVQFVALNETLRVDKGTAKELAAKFNASYPKTALDDIDIDQEKTLGSLQSLFLAIVNGNPWYVIGFFLVALILDILLIYWFYYTREVIFARRSLIVFAGLPKDRVRYLWIPPMDNTTR